MATAPSSSEATKPSFSLVLLPKGFVIRPSPPWEGASPSHSLATALSAVSHLSHVYDQRWVELAHELLVMHSLPSALRAIEKAVPGGLEFNEGCCVVEVWDYRRCAARGLADVERITLRPSSASVRRDAEEEWNALRSTDPLADEEAEMARRLGIESALLAATRKNLQLDAPGERGRASPG